MRQQLRPALVVLGLLTLITGVLYPLATVGDHSRRAGGVS